MKKGIYLSVVAAVMLSACKTNLKNDVSGTYVSESQGEYSVSKDTLLISSLSEDVKAFRIVKNSAFQKIRNGKLKPTEYDSMTWQGSFDEKSLTLTTSPEGKTFLFYPEKKTVMIGKREYHKLEE